MFKVVDIVVDIVDLFGIGCSIFDKMIGVLWDLLIFDVFEEDLVIFVKGL